MTTYGRLRTEDPRYGNPCDYGMDSGPCGKPAVYALVASDMLACCEHADEAEARDVDIYLADAVEVE